MSNSFLKTFLKIIFPLSLLIAVSIDIFYRFNLQEGRRGYTIAIVAYLYFCLYLGLILFKKIIKIKSSLIKCIIFIFNWFIPITILLHSDSIPQKGILSSLIDVIFFTLFFCAVFFTFSPIFRFRKFIVFSVLVLVLISTAIWFVLNKGQPSPEPKNAGDDITVVVQEIQPWQLNSRYKITGVAKFLKVDLDNDGKQELAAITTYDKIPDTVFYYAGFFRYNPATEVWDEFYGEELNIFNYGILKKEDVDNEAEYTQEIIKMWSTEFTTLENIGDVTGDGSPEIVFSSLIQDIFSDNNIIVAQAGQSHFRFKIASFMDPVAEIVAEDGLLIEKYFDGDFEIKKIYRWGQSDMGFKLIETQKKKMPEPTSPPQAIPGIEDLAG